MYNNAPDSYESGVQRAKKAINRQNAKQSKAFPSGGRWQKSSLFTFGLMGSSSVGFTKH